MSPRRWQLLGVTVLCTAVAAGLASCGSGSRPHDPYPAPPADRPVIDLSFTMADDLSSASGIEKVTFTPTQRICELVFRSWANKPATARTGNALTVNSIRFDGRNLPLQVSSAGAPRGAPGTLVEATLPACRGEGEEVAVEVSFDIRLGAGTDERVGYSRREQIAWLGSAYPMLAWTRADGWVRDDAVDVVGETATSEVFRLRSLDVNAPSEYAVGAIGRPEGTPSAAPDGRTRHRFTADAVRDVTFTVGNIDVTSTSTDGLTIAVALPRGRVRADAGAWDTALRRALHGLSSLLGPIPTDHVSLSILPDVSEGVEFGQAIQFADVDPDKDRWLITHELAHLWFYGLVGNNQARDPWLDEAFATYAQEVVDRSGTTKNRGHIVKGAVGESMEQWSRRGRADAQYVDTVYGGGGRALLQARDAAGADAFDAAIQEYIRRAAWQIATPADAAAALEHLPSATAALRAAGALR